MPVVLLRLPVEELQANLRPDRCPYCGSKVLQAWGCVSRIVQDIDRRETVVYRYRCIECERTFRNHPEGIDRSRQSLRVRRLAALAVTLGLTIRDVVQIFENLGLPVSRSTVWRESKSFAEELAAGPANPCLNFVMDRVYPRNVKQVGVKLVIAIGQKKYAVLGTLDEHDPRQVVCCLQPLVEAFDIELSVIETDLIHHPAEQAEVYYPSPV